MSKEIINILSEYEKSLLLQYYCTAGDVNGVRFALSVGADINRPNRDKVIPLHFACAARNIDVVRLLVARGADLQYRNPNYNNRNALEIAREYSHKIEEFLESILQQNRKIGPEKHDLKVQQEDLRLETETGKQDFVPEDTEILNILLIMYARDGNVDGVRKKLSMGANIEFRDFAGRTPLFQAARTGYNEVVSFLLKAGANVNAGHDALHGGNHHRSPILTAFFSKHFDTARILQQAGATVDVPDEDGRTLLHEMAKSLPSFDIEYWVSGILEFGANIEARDKYGCTPLHLTTWRIENFNVAGELLKHGADANARDGKGRTALSMAVNKNYFFIVRMLLHYGAKINDLVDGITPLMIAANKGLVQMGMMLLQYGADPDAETADGLTAADFARKANHPDFVTLLQHSRDIHHEDPRKEMYFRTRSIR